MKLARLPSLLLALAAVAALAALGDAPPAAPAAAAPLPAIRAVAPRAPAAAPATDPFADPSSPPAADAAAPAVEPVPTISAPRLPWQVIGKQHADEEGWSVFLADGSRTLVVRAGDTLDDTYRVQAIAPPTLTLRHLKHRTQRTLDIGEARE